MAMIMVGISYNRMIHSIQKGIYSLSGRYPLIPHPHYNDLTNLQATITMGFSFFKRFQRKDKGKRSIAQVIRLLIRSNARGGPSITNPRGMFLVSTESACVIPTT
jgi:hypothetical protein